MPAIRSLILVLVCLVFGRVSGQHDTRDDDMSTLLRSIQQLNDHLATSFRGLIEVMHAEVGRRRALQEQLDMCVNSSDGLKPRMSTTQPPPSPTSTSPHATTMTLHEGSSGVETSLCEDGYLTFEDHCYLIDTVKRNWTDAQEACQGVGAYLVSINTQAEQNFLVSHLDENIYYWIGIMWMPSGMVWLDGNDVDYTSWGPHEPNCMATGCKAFLSPSYSHSWEDAMSDYKYYSICEVEMSPYEPTDVCPPGYHAFGGQCYIFELEKVIWHNADWVCKGQGAYLLSINNQAEWEFIIEKIRRYYDTDGNGFWLGIEYNQSERRLQWEDGTEVTYTRWGPGRPPSCVRNDCQAYFFDFTREKWHLVREPFQKERFYICETEQTPLH